MKFKKIIFILVNAILLFSLFFVFTLLKFDIKNYLKFIFLMIGIFLFLLAILFKFLHKSKSFKIFYFLFVLYSIIVNVYIFLLRLGILDTLSSVSKLKEYILSTKEKGVITYILLQSAQVIFLPVPAAVICIVGSLVYGPFLGAIYCTAGILLGSYISYFIGKIFGYKIVSWIVGKENVDKYSVIIKKRGKFFLGLAFLLPMFPDDILCLIAGITDMSFTSFFWITLITRPIGVVCMSYFGSGTIIPFSGWGIYAWVGILILAIALVIIISKYQDRMQNFILRKVLRRQ